MIAMTLAKYQDWTKQVQARRDGGESSVLGYLSAQRVRLHVSTTPPGAAVIINDKVHGRTPLDLADLDPEATRSLKVELKGYVSETRALDWSAGTKLDVDIALRP